MANKRGFLEPLGRFFGRQGLKRSEMAILVAVTIMAAVTLTVIDVTGAGKPRENLRLGQQIAADLRATVAKSPSTAPSADPGTAAASPSTSSPSTSSRSTKSAPRKPASTTTTTVPPAKIQWVTTTHTISFQGMTRSYLVAAPTAPLKGKVPVIVVLHGINATPQLEEQRTGLLPLVGPAILVYPTGYDMSWNAGTCCGPAFTAGLNDVGFVTAVTQQVLATHSAAAANQVFLLGYSNGGKLAWDIACQGSTVFRAVAAYGAVPATTCPKVGPVPAIVMAGNNDPEIAVDNSQPKITEDNFAEPTVQQFVTELRTDDACSGASTAQTTGTETTTIWAHCASGMAVAQTIFNGQDHTWPEGTSTTPSAQQIIWGFFRSMGAT